MSLLHLSRHLSSARVAAAAPTNVLHVRSLRDPLGSLLHSDRRFSTSLISESGCNAWRLSDEVLFEKLINSTTYARKFPSIRQISSPLRLQSTPLVKSLLLHHAVPLQTWSRDVSTWSPLGAAFNAAAKPDRRFFPNVTSDPVGLFGIPELKDYTGFYVLDERARARTDELVQEVLDPTRRRAVVKIFDELSDTLCCVADMADFVRVAHPDAKVAGAAEDACASISSLVESLNVNVDIYRTLQHALECGEPGIAPTDAVDRRVAELFLFDFEQSGIHLDRDRRNHFVRLNDAILTLGGQFTRGCQEGATLPGDQLPGHLSGVFGGGGKELTVTGMGLVSESGEERVREAVYRIYLHPDQRQEERLTALLAARQELARLTGFESYARRALRGTLGATPERVMHFLQLLADEVRPAAERETAHLAAMKRSHEGGSGQIQPWDTAYYGALARREACGYDSAALAPYFSLGACMEGLNELFSALYGVTLLPVRPFLGEIWSDDVQKLAVVQGNGETGETLGHIYCDFFERPGKPRQDCHFTIRGGRQLADGSYQRPVVALMLNLGRGGGGGGWGGLGGSGGRAQPCLLMHGAVENLFHEFGHAMHSMLGRTRYQHVTGTRCPTDFAEVPSVLMEYFASDARVLATFARHWRTGEPLGADRLDRLCQAKRLFSASETQLQVFYSIVDQMFHGAHPLAPCPPGSEGGLASPPAGMTTTDVMAALQSRYHGVPHVPDTAWHLRFSHLVGYGAKYYSYLMSRAVASQIWHRCFRDDPFSRTMGERYRATVLAHGGETAPALLVENMLGVTPTTEMLVGALAEELKADSAIGLN